MMNNTQQEALATLKTGIVTAVKPGYIQASIPEFGDFITDWLPVLIFGDTQSNKSFAMPSVGAQVKLLLDARGEDGVCLGSIYSDVDTPTAPNTEAIHTTFSDGAVIEYDPASSTLKASGFNSAVLSGGTVDINASLTTINGQLVVNGLLTFTAGMAGSGGSGASVAGDITATGEITGSGVKLSEHTHSGVMPGGGNTGNPS